MLKRNTGHGKVFPGGPICNFKGVDIPTLVCHSKSGGITAEILRGVLQHYDKYIPRQPGEPMPACILDGHGSRFSIEVVDYIRNQENNIVDPNADHAWHLYIGLPNGTAYWQVGDSLYQNGRNKNLTRKIKELIRDRQRLNHEPIKIRRSDIVYMLSKAWPDCYGDLEGNRKAIRERGWGPLNRGVLHHPDILLTKKNVLSPSTITTTVVADGRLDDANVSSGAAFSILTKLSASKRRDIGREAQFKKQQQLNKDNRNDNKKREKALLSAVRITAGVVYEHGIYNADDNVLADDLHRRHNNRIAKGNKTIFNKYDVDIQRYNEGLEMMKKEDLYQKALVQDLLGVTDDKKKKKIIKRLKKEKKWLLNDDYLCLIRFKQLCLTDKPTIPTVLAVRKHLWSTQYRRMPNPLVPVIPLNYVAADDVSVEDLPEVGLVSLGVLNRNLDMLASLPHLNTFSDAVEQDERMAAADLLMNIQIQEI